jgi:hypothetical protein
MVPVRIDGAMTYDLTGTPDIEERQVIGLKELEKRTVIL